MNAKKAPTLAASMKIQIDENEVDTFNKVKKFGSTAVEKTKRAALGDLQNRAVLRNVSIKDTAAAKDLKATTKARVDSHWKKLPAVANNNNTTNTNNNSSNSISNQKINESNKVGGVTAAVAQRKVLTRSNSVRLGHSSCCVAGSTLQSKSKTLTTSKVIENKVQPVKVAPKTKLAKDEKPTISVPPLRREDSNLSRRSLTKLKAVLAREAAAVTKSNKAASVATVAVGPKDSKIVPPTKTTKKIQQSSDLKIIKVETHSSKLISDVEDIDAGDGGNLVLVSEYVNDIYSYLFSLEDIHSIRQNHLSEHKEIYPKMRAVLIDWINEVHTQFHCVAETFQLAVAIIDRYLQAVNDTKRSHLQLVGVTALFIAAKYEELFPPAINDFVYITDETYSTQQILQMEIKIMKVIDFNLSRPLPLHFLRRFSKAASAVDIHHAMAKYFLELSLIDYDLAHYKPSEVAAASIFLSLQLINGNSEMPTGFDDTHWTATLEYHSRYSTKHLRPIVRKIATIARNAANAKLKSVYTKYQSQSMLNVSVRPELTSALINSIINSKD